MVFTAPCFDPTLSVLITSYGNYINMYLIKYFLSPFNVIHNELCFFYKFYNEIFGKFNYE